MSKKSHKRWRGALLGPALFLLPSLAPPVAVADPAIRAASAEPYYRLIRRMLRNESYILIESDSAPPHIVFLSDGAGQSTDSLSPKDRALLDLTSASADVREEAVLALADTGDDDAMANLQLALNDPDQSVREAAEAVLDL